jgi:glycosyltransferase involved in cell wall biosynthesis
MKILHVSNNPDIHSDSKILWNNLIYPLKQRAEVREVGKKQLFRFYFDYLKFKPDLILTTWVPAAFIPIFLKRLGLIKCPIIHRWEDYYAETMKNYPYKLVKFMEDYSAKNADHLIVIHKTIYKKALSMNKSAFLLPYGTTTGEKETSINLDNLKTKKNNLKVIYLGEINLPFKRVDKIINAAIEIECDLFLFGEEPKEEYKLLMKGHKNIHYLGWVNPEEVISLLRQGDILVNTADLDMSMKFLDYVRAKKPILALNKRPAEFFKHKKTAFLTSNFKEGLKELIKDKELRKTLSKNLSSIKLYSWDEIADIHINLYNKILVADKNLEEFKTSYYHVQD